MTATMPRTTAGPTPVPTLRRRRSSRLLLGAVLLAVLGGLVGLYLHNQGAVRSGVVGVARPIPFGQVVTEADLREVLLPPDTGLATVPWSSVDSVVGGFAVTQLWPGQTLPPDAVVAERIPGAGEAVIGLSVEPGQLPVTPLAPRDVVLVITSDGSRRATVLRTGEPDATGRRTVDLLVTEPVAAALARGAADGSTVLVLVGEE